MIGVENKAHSWVEGIIMKFMKFFTLVRLKEHTELIIRKNVGLKSYVLYLTNNNEPHSIQTLSISNSNPSVNQ